MMFEIHQSVHRYEGRDGYWNWALWIEGAEADLDQVKEVHYFLHRTFPEPHRIRRNRADRFELKSAGWGEFILNIEIHMKDGSVEHHEHWLELASRVSPRPARNSGALSGAKPNVFISHVATDSDAANTAMSALRQKGYEVLSADQIESGASSSPGFQGIHDADIVLAILPKRSSQWMEHEIAQANDEKKPVIGVALGGRTTVEIGGLGEERVVKDPEDIAAAVRDIIERS